MKLEINPRGNGACPLCAANGNCRLQSKLTSSLAPVTAEAELEMEIVVYSCPYFQENA